MKLVVVLALFALAVAGCVQPAAKVAPGSIVPPSDLGGVPVGNVGVLHDATGKILAANASNMTRMVGGEFNFPASSTEPSIGADAKGGVYMTGQGRGGVAATAGRGYPTIWATFDGGQTMKDVGPKLPTGDGAHPNSNDPILYVDYATGRVFDDDILPLSCGALSFSDDQGKTWTTNPYSCGNNNVNDHQTIATSKARMLPTVGYPNVVYRCVNNGAATECAMSYNGGLSFTPQVPVFLAPRDGCGGLEGHLKGGPDGKMYLPIASCPGGPKIMVTADDGLSWNPIVIKIPSDMRVTNHDLGLAIDSSNNLYATFEAGGYNYYSASADGGKTWLPVRNITAPGVTATMFNTLAVGDPGHVAFAYVGTTIDGGYAGKCKGNAGLNGDLLGQPVCPEWANATWNAYMGVITDALDPNAPIQSVTANDISDPIARGLCGGTRCHGMNDFIDISIDNAGRPWASFVDVCTQKCVTDPTVQSDTVRGAMMTLREGPTLRGPDGPLPVLALQVKAAAS